MNNKICGKCQIEYRVERSGIAVVEMVSTGPIAVWSGDLYKCPECRSELITGIANEPEVRTNCGHYLIALYNNKRRLIYPIWLNTREKRLFEEWYPDLRYWLDDFTKRCLIQSTKEST